MRKALVEFHYAADGKNAVRYLAGANVPVKSEHVDQLVAEGKLEGDQPSVRKAKRSRKR